MRVGFVTQLLWERYGPLWLRLVRDAGAEPSVADAAAVRTALQAPRVAAIGPLAFRLAAAQAVALSDADLLVVPDLNAVEEDEAPSGRLARGGGADPWIADFPDALRSTVAGLPPLVAVPAFTGPGIERTVVPALQNLVHDAHAVRRIWARRRAEARPPRPRAPRWTLVPGEHRVVGLVGQPWLLNDALAERAADEGDHVVAQHRLDPDQLRREAGRVDASLVPTDAEVIGAGRLFARRGGVGLVRVVADRGSGADAWLVDRLRAHVRKPVEVRYLQDVLAGLDPVDSLLVTSVD
ncbi:MAG: hypothetical protein P8Y13_11840 [Deinococcales bacterium]